VSADSQPKVCLGKSECVGAFTTGTDKQLIENSCDCGKNGSGNKYCAPFLGDMVGINYVELLQELVSPNANGFCPTSERLSDKCAEKYVSERTNVNDINEILTSKLLFENYAQLQGNDYCVKETYNQNYWNNLPSGGDGDDDDNDDDDFATILSLLVAFNLAI
jgi:hypothetical protein